MADDARESWERKLELVRSKVKGVAKGYSRGLYLWGEGGTSKTWTVTRTLEQLGVPHLVTNTHATAKGLYSKLKDHPDATHVVDDVARLEDGAGVCRLLLSALDTAEVRTVTWESAGGSSFEFRGGVILIANYDLAEAPQLRALASRVTRHHHRPTQEELLCIMSDVAARGFTHRAGSLSSAQCMEVLDAVTALSRETGRPLDIRRLVNGFGFRLQHENKDSSVPWRVMVESDMREGAPPAGRAEKKARAMAVLRDLPSMTREEMQAEFHKATGLSRATMYRLLEELSRETETVRLASQNLKKPAKH